MAGIYITPEGFLVKTLAEIKAELEAEYRGEFGDDIDLDPESPFGQMVGIGSQREKNIWDALLEIYQSRNPNAAEGVQLDMISAETGTERLDPAPSVVNPAVLYGTPGTTVPAGKQARRYPAYEEDSTNPKTFSLVDDCLISDTAAFDVWLTPDDPTAGGVVFTVNVNGTDYTYTSDPGDTESDVVGELVTLIDAGTDLVEASNETGVLRLFGIDRTFSVTYTATLTEDLLGGLGSFVCDVEGPYPVPATTLSVIATPVGGWDSVNNPAAGTTGRLAESDTALRLRREQELDSTGGTESGLRRALLNVDGVIAASVTSNRTLVDDLEGRPGKSFEAVVAGGTDADIGAAIWANQPGGIQSFGSVDVVVQDQEGNDQTVYFSRPTIVYIWVRISRDYNTEETYPTTGDTMIKEAIVAWALDNIGTGADIIRQRLSTPVYQVPGVGDIVIELARTAGPSDIPSYAEANLTIANREQPSFDVARIVVQDIP